MKNAVSANSELDTFIDFLFGGLEGLVYVAAKDPKDPDPETNWTQKFFSYPSDVGSLKAALTRASESHEIYLGPAVYKAPKATKENIKCSNVVWTEFDGNAPEFTEGLLSDNPPSLIVQSSSHKNQHVYWRLTEPCYEVETLEHVNRAITYGLKADTSAWDSTQVLRPPQTRNHKRGGVAVSLFHSSDYTYDIEVFGSLPTPPKQDDTKWELGALPDLQDVILRYSFPPDMVLLLKKSKEDLSQGNGQRARSLTNLAYGCCELGMTDNEVFVMLSSAAARWDKFTGRKDRNQNLAKIITIARNKHPYTGEEPTEVEDEQFTFAFDFISFLATEIEANWLIEPMLTDQGAMLMVGPSGVGKTQWSLQAMIHLALGKDFLHYKIPEAKKVAFLSLEMDHGSLKVFLSSMAEALTDAEKDMLAQNFLVVPHGEPWYLNLPVGQQHAIDLVEAYEPDVFFVDSIGSAIKGNLSSDEDVQALLEFNDRLRKKYKCSVWYIHHTRKTGQGQSHATTQDDIYGNQYLLNRATSSYGMFRAKAGALRMKNFKNRLAPMEDDYFIKRTDHLNFEKVEKSSPTMKDMIYEKPEEDKGPQPEAGGFML